MVLHIFRREDLSKMRQPSLILSPLQGWRAEADSYNRISNLNLTLGDISRQWGAQFILSLFKREVHMVHSSTFVVYARQELTLGGGGGGLIPNPGKNGSFSLTDILADRVFAWDRA